MLSFSALAIDVPLAVIVPAAGVGKRMQANCPKQYLRIEQHTILEHTVTRLLAHPAIEKVIIAISENDQYFSSTSLSNHPKVQAVNGGVERVDSVLMALKTLDAKRYPWVMVHDAARPCVSLHDIDLLITTCLQKNSGGLLASPVKDTMKRGNKHHVVETVERAQLWHALTPQMYRANDLLFAIEKAMANNVVITDESSAIEYVNKPSLLVCASSDNIKITRPEDLALAAFILSQQKQSPIQVTA